MLLWGKSLVHRGRQGVRRYDLGVEFIDGGGGLYVKHVSGNYRFVRK